MLKNQFIVGKDEINKNMHESANVSMNRPNCQNRQNRQNLAKTGKYVKIVEINMCPKSEKFANNR